MESNHPWTSRKKEPPQTQMTVRGHDRLTGVKTGVLYSIMLALTPTLIHSEDLLKTFIILKNISKIFFVKCIFVKEFA